MYRVATAQGLLDRLRRRSAAARRGVDLSAFFIGVIVALLYYAARARRQRRMVDAELVVDDNARAQNKV